MAEVEEVQETNNESETNPEKTEKTSKGDKDVIYPQIITTVIVTLAMYTTGLSYGWPSISLLNFEKDFPGIRMNSDQRSWVVTALPLGSCFGAMTPAFLADYIGRKWFLVITCLPPLASWILVYFAKDWTYILIARLIAGLLIGSLLTVVPQYISEIVETRIRGASSVMMVVLLHLGYITIYGIGPLLDGKMLALICLIPSVFLLVQFPWLPESPYYYLKKNKKKDAELSLMWLRRVRNNEDALNRINEYIEMEKGGNVKHLFTDKVNRRSFLIVLLLLAGQQLSGFMAVQSYVGLLVKDMHFNLNTNMILIILGLINLVAGLVATFTVDKIGRKPLFLVSTYIVALSAGVIGTYFLLQDNKFNTKKFAIMPVVAVAVHNIAFNVGLSSIPAVVTAEMFPMNIKIWAGSFANTFSAVLSVIVSKIFEPIVEAAGYKTIFYIFALIEIIIATTAVFVMPETKCKSLAEIQHMLREPSHKEKEQNEDNETA